MEWQIRTLAHKSTLSGEPFAPGDRVASLIFTGAEAGELGRADLRLEEVEAFELPGNLIGRWTREVKHPDDEAAEARDRMASAEDFFHSLYAHEGGDAGEGGRDREVVDSLKHLLALLLERKRILRPVGPRRSTGEQVYRQTKSKREFSVPIVEISPQLMLKIEDSIGEIMH
jgi:hypothetical protein